MGIRSMMTVCLRLLTLTMITVLVLGVIPAASAEQIYVVFGDVGQVRNFQSYVSSQNEALYLYGLEGAEVGFNYVDFPAGHGLPTTARLFSMRVHLSDPNLAETRERFKECYQMALMTQARGERYNLQIWINLTDSTQPVLRSSNWLEVTWGTKVAAFTCTLVKQ